MRPISPKKQMLPADSPDALTVDPSTVDLDQMYKDLKINERRLELAVEMGGVGLWSLDLESQVYWINNKTREIFQFPTLMEVTFEDFLDRVYPDDRLLIKEEVQRVLQSGMQGRVEYRIVLPDGLMRWIFSQGTMHSCTGENSSCLMGVSVDITDKKTKEAIIDRELDFEILLAETSATFATFDLAGDVDEQIEKSLARVLDYFGGDRCGLIRLDPVKRETRITHAFYREGLERVPPDTDLASLFPWTFNLEVTGQSVCFSDFSELPPESNIDQENWQAMGVKSAFQIPILVSENVCYLILTQSLVRTIYWPTETFPRLKILGEIFINAIYKKKAQEKLENSYQEIKQLKEKLEVEADYLRAEVRSGNLSKDIIGQSAPIKNVMAMVAQVGPTSSTVLICGETGTGKELIAQAIHDASPCRSHLMVKVNCASLPSALIESELFGRERGAYTGALTRQIGRFELADASSIFLDEISELPMDLQSKLLRVLQEGEFERLGAPKTIKVDVRVIAATNRNLFEEVKKGRFRDDLYYRLNVFPLVVPPLRERQEDIPMLVWGFIRFFNEKMGKRIQRIPKGQMTMLQAYSWPGNIRELRNVIEYAAIVSTGEELNIKIPNNNGDSHSESTTLEEMESRHILNILKKTGWRIKGDDGAAQILGINPATLYSRMKKLGITLNEKKTAYNP